MLFFRSRLFLEHDATVLLNTRLLKGIQLALQTREFSGRFLIAFDKESRRPEQNNRHTRRNGIVARLFVLNSGDLPGSLADPGSFLLNLPTTERFVSQRGNIGSLNVFYFFRTTR